MFHLEEFRKSDDSVQRRTDFKAHVVEECVFHHFHLLGAQCLCRKFLLNRLDLTDVTAHAEVLFHVSLPVVYRDEVELQEETVAGIIAEDSLDLRVNGLCCETVHALQYVLSPAAGTVINEMHDACLCKRILHLISLAIDVQCVGIWVVTHYSYATHMQHIVDVADVMIDLVIVLSYILNILLDLLV